MEPKEVKIALKFYESAYYKASTVFGIIGILAVAVLATLVITDPLKLYGLGTYTTTDVDYLYDCDFYRSYDDAAMGCVGKWVTTGVKVYGHPMAIMVLVYGNAVAAAIAILGIVLGPRRAARQVAAILAIKKTLGLNDEKDE